MYMTVKTSSREDFSLTRNNFSAWTDVNIYIGLCIWVPCFSYSADTAVAQRNISFVNAGVVQDKRICDYSVGRACSSRGLGLPHTVANDFATAKFHLFSIDGQIALNFDHKLCIGQSQFVARGWPIHPRVVIS